MTDARRPRAARTAAPPEPVGLPTLLAWRRTGLVAGVAAVLAVLASVAVLARWRADAGVAGGVLLMTAFVCALVALAFLRRAWSDPEVSADPAVVRARRWAEVATVSWCVAFLPGLAARALPEAFDWLRWLVLGLGVVAVVAFLGMLVIAARWRPSAS